MLDGLSSELDAYANGRGGAGGGGGNTPAVLNTATTNQNGIQISLSISGTNVDTPPMPGETFTHVDDTTIANGYVVRDSANGNEFVWIPVAKDQVISLNVETEEDITSIKLYNVYGAEVLNIAGSSLEDKKNYSGEVETYGNSNCINGTYKAVVTTANKEENASLFVTSLYAKLGLKDYYMSEDFAIAKGYQDMDAFLEDWGYETVEEMYEEEYEWEEDFVDPTETDTDKSIIVTKYGKSVNDNGGFYIGRYEAGIGIGNTRTSGSSTNDSTTYETIKTASGVPVSKKDVYTYNYVTQPQAKYLAESMYSGKSSLLTGAAWDRVLGFITEAGTGSKTLSQVAGNSNTWGNYSDSTGDAAVVVNSENQFGVLQTTGYSTYWQAKNIFDLAGNTYEWTLQNSDNTQSAGLLGRGGIYFDSGVSAHTHIYGDSGVCYVHLSFRPALYL